MWYLVGVQLAFYFPDFWRMKSGIKNIGVAFCILCFLITFNYLVRKNTFLMVVTQLVTIIYFVTVFCGCIDWEHFIIRKMMKKSFVIYSWHGMVCTFFAKLIFHFFPTSYITEVFAYVSYIVIGLTAIVVLDELFKKYAPSIRGVFLGGRDRV
jgi:uncharacterized membrane protein YuzA (DUF378 family)